MADLLTSQEIIKLRSKSKPDSQLPVVYENNINPARPISRTYEAHLILTEDKVKKDALEWIDKAISILREVNEDREELFNEYLGNLRNDAEQQAGELESYFEGYEKFRQDFTKTKFDPSESSWLFEALTLAIGQLNSKKSIQDHKTALLNVIEAKAKK